MHTATVVLTLASFAGYVTAASSWTVDPSCDAAFIVLSCIDTVDTQIMACPGNDWQCLCTNYKTLQDNCYANCPNDPSMASVKTTVLQYCNAYSATISLSSTATSSSSAGTSSPSPASTTTSTSSSGSPASSNTSSSSPTPGAGFVVTPAHSYGALAGFLAVAGAFL